VSSSESAPAHKLGTGDGANPLDKLQSALGAADATGDSSEPPFNVHRRNQAHPRAEVVVTDGVQGNV
jgi:hypothetical protein